MSTFYWYSFAWRGAEHSGCYFHTQEERDRSLAEVLVHIGWTQPKWWQFWRWGEQKPNEGAVALMDEVRPEVERRRASIQRPGG